MKLRRTEEARVGADVLTVDELPDWLDRWIRPGQTVELEIDGIRTLANRVSPDARP